MSIPNPDDFWTILAAQSTGSSTEDFVESYLASTDGVEEGVERVAGAVETRLQGRSMNDGAFTTLRALTDAGRQANAVGVDVAAGTRVQFVATVDSLFSYSDAPNPDANGVVVAVKTASGMSTTHAGHVFVRWDDGKIRLMASNHLRRAVGKIRTSESQMANCIRVASLGDLSDFLRVAGSDSTLVHRATKDLWSLHQEGPEFVIERLFNETGAPLKV